MVTIRLKDKKTGKESFTVDLEELIYNQNEIDFVFGEIGDEFFRTLPYKDFLFFKDDYDVIVHINNGGSNE